MPQTYEPTRPKARVGFVVLLGIFSSLINTVLSLIAIPYLITSLGDAAYGTLALVSVFASYFAYLDFGIGASYARELAIAIAKQDNERAQLLYETVHFLYTRMALVGFAGMLLLGGPYMWFIIKDPSLLVEAWLALFVAATSFAASMSLSAPRYVAFCSQRPEIHGKVLLPFQPIIPLLQIFIVLSGGSIVGVMLVQSVFGVCVDLAMWFFAKKLQPWLILRRRYHPDLWGELRSFSAWKFATTIFQQGQATADRILLSALRPVEELASYSVAGSVAIRVRSLLMGPLQGPFFIASVEAFAAGGMEALATLTQTLCRRVATVLALASAGICFLAEPLFIAWVGPSYAKEGAPILCVATLTASLLAVVSIMGQASDAAKQPQPLAKGAIFGLLVGVVFSLLLAPTYGSIGVAISFLIGAFLQFIYVTYFFLIMTRIDTKSFVSFLLFKPLIIGCFSYFTMCLFPEDSFLFSFVNASIASFPAVLLGVLFQSIRYEDIPERFRKKKEI